MRGQAHLRLFTLDFLADKLQSVNVKQLADLYLVNIHFKSCLFGSLTLRYADILLENYPLIVSGVFLRNIHKKMTGRTKPRVAPEDGAAPLPPNPMLKFYLFAWGVPVIICGITGAVNIHVNSDAGVSND